MLATCVDHFLGLVQAMTTEVDKATIDQINSDILKTREVLSTIKDIFASK